MYIHTICRLIVVMTDNIRPFPIIANRYHFVRNHFLLVKRIGFVGVACLQRIVEHQILLLRIIVKEIHFAVLLTQKSSIIDRSRIILTPIHFHISLSVFYYFFVQQHELVEMIA